MKVAPLRYDVIFKKAFRQPVLFKALVKDLLHIDNFEIDEVENDKAFYPPIGNVNFKFEIEAEDKKNRIVVEMQHAHYSDTYERFMYYQLCAMIESIASSKNYSFPVTVNTVVFFTKKRTPSPNSGLLELDFQARDTYDGRVIEKVFGKRKHRLLFVYVNDFNDAYSSPESAKWMEAFYDTLDSEVSPENYKNPHIGEMFEIIKEDNITPDERAQMKEEYNLEEGEKTALEKGREEGLEEAARRLLLAGSMSAEQIADIIGLNLERVKALSAE
jgi:predicted transposase/invertase (TIGR01784 family)